MSEHSAGDEPRRCLNCGHPAGPRFCGHCGQAIDAHRTALLPLLGELIEESLSVDGRALRTLRALPRPGMLTRLYLDGKRVSFLGPLRLYLLASLVNRGAEAPRCKRVVMNYITCFGSSGADS